MNQELKKLLKDSRNVRRPLKANMDNAAMTRLKAKVPSESILLSTMESTDGFRYEGPGGISTSDAYSLYNTTSIKMVVPNTPEEPIADRRYHGDGDLFFDVHGADWNHFNRLSFWVYADCEGYQNVCVNMRMQNLHKEDGGTDYYKHNMNIPNREWTQVIWEIPDTNRDCVDHIVIRHHMPGGLPNMASEAVFYLNKLELAAVEADHYEGWELDSRIAFCHSGYRARDRKVAATQNSGAAEFSLMDAESNAVAYSAPVRTVSYDIGTFDVLDFTDFAREGKYVIRIGDRTTKPFCIGPDVWDSAVWKTVNFFMQERCGTDVPGIHVPCHLDCFCIHPDGRKVCVAGGWHDAGDVSQGLCNTSEAAHAMLDMAERVRESNPDMAERLMDEARWGLNWALGTRFGDGYRCTWNTMGVWTDNIIDDSHHMHQPAGNDPLENLYAASAEAAGARFFAGEDDAFAAYCLKCAREDYAFAMESACPGNDMSATNEIANALDLHSQAAVAAMELYRACGEESYLEQAAAHAERIMSFQQQEMPDWDIPVRGFFYRDAAHLHPLNYIHRAHEQAPLMALSLLHRFAPADRRKSSWEKSLRLYAEYIKTIDRFLQPYSLLPGGIYYVKDASDATNPTLSADARMMAASALNGIRLSEHYYLRRMPAATTWSGFFGVVLTKAKAAATTASALQDDVLQDIARSQLEWVIGNNPFARSYMYGEGYDFAPQFTFFADDIVGEVPVGIRTRGNSDKPYMPLTVTTVYQEIWVHPSSRLLWTISDIY